jgi:hypothetical protein
MQILPLLEMQSRQYNRSDEATPYKGDEAVVHKVVLNPGRSSGPPVNPDLKPLGAGGSKDSHTPIRRLQLVLRASEALEDGPAVTGSWIRRRLTRPSASRSTTFARGACSTRALSAPARIHPVVRAASWCSLSPEQLPR